MSASEQVQVQPLPLTPDTCEHHCSPSPAHESLRRFAEGYIFGAVSCIGCSSPPNPYPQTGMTNATAFVGADGKTFASCAVPTKSEDADSWEKPARKRMDGKRMEGTRMEGKRSVLLFGDNAPKVGLPVKARIERPNVPKRCRETVSVDSLSAMMETLLGKQKGRSKRPKASDAEEELSNVFCDLKVKRRAGDKTGRGKTSKVEKHKKIEECVEEGEGNGRKEEEQVSRFEDDDTADELSFLVDRCDLDSEKRQATFMPYIT